MSQKFSLYDDLSVAENIDFFSGVYTVPQELRPARKKYVLQMAGLENRGDTMTHLLPTGWKQRLALGCAILHQPPILFLDEPTSGVDPIARRSFWDLIYQLSAEGHTVFVTTHYMDEAEYCHRLALMHRGRLIGLGSAAELRAALVSHTLMHLESTDVLESLRALEQCSEVVEAAVFGSGLHLMVRDAAAAESAIRAALAERGIEVKRLAVIEPSMGLTVVANVAYHFCQKAISPNANPLVSLFFTYLSGMLITLVCIPLFYPGLQIGSAVKELNWATFVLGFGIVGLELGFLLAYRAGWNLSLGALYSNVMVTVLLLPIGVLVFKETLTGRHWVGLALALSGLMLLGNK